MRKKRSKQHHIGPGAVLVVALMAGSVIQAQAADLGHYAPALLSIPDFILPDPGFYYVQYHLYYTADTLKDKNGRSIDAITVGPIEFDVGTEVESFMIVPTLIYSSDFSIL